MEPIFYCAALSKTMDICGMFRRSVQVFATAAFTTTTTHWAVSSKAIDVRDTFFPATFRLSPFSWMVGYSDCTREPRARPCSGVGRSYPCESQKPRY